MCGPGGVPPVTSGGREVTGGALAGAARSPGVAAGSATRAGVASAAISRFFIAASLQTEVDAAKRRRWLARQQKNDCVFLIRLGGVTNRLKGGLQTGNGPVI